MDVKAILKARGLSDENIDNLINKPEYASILESFISEAENGKTALLKAQEIEQNLKTWNETQVVPYVRAADEKVAKITAENAALKTHYKVMRDAGYEVPAAFTEGEPTPSPVKTESPKGFSQEDFDKGAMSIAETNIALVSLSNRHRKLTGDELDLDAEYSDFKTNRRPSENLRDYVGRKYDHSGLQAKRAQESEQKKLDEYAASKVAEEKAKWTQSNGVNPETRNPRASRFDEIRKDEGRTKLWQTAAGREEATKRRLEKYTSLVQ